MEQVSTPPLVPSSMSGGNTVADSPQLAMTAPGTQSVNGYVPEAMDHLPLPEFAGPEIPVSTERDRTDGNPAPVRAGGPWREVTEGGNGGWRQL